jgi:3alpha(or 20beta)-hydroxysteroid dehydrogenase
MARFTDKVCIVTGGASGIGEKTAEMFVEQGGKVVVGDVNDERGTEICERIGADKAVYMHLDVTDPDACQAAVDLAVETFGGVDGVVNSAVKMAPGLLKDLPLENWNLMLNVGLTGTFLMTRASPTVCPAPIPP